MKIDITCSCNKSYFYIQQKNDLVQWVKVKSIATEYRNADRNNRAVTTFTLCTYCQILRSLSRLLLHSRQLYII